MNCSSYCLIESLVQTKSPISFSSQGGMFKFRSKFLAQFCWIAFSAISKDSFPAKLKFFHWKLAMLTAIDGIPSKVPSSAAATVPEQKISVPRLGPWLIPERIKSGFWSRSSLSASFTQSAGVPLHPQALIPSPNNSSAFSARIGECKVNPWPVADLSWSGQTTVTSCPLLAADVASVLIPSAKTPSSLPVSYTHLTLPTKA